MPSIQNPAYYERASFIAPGRADDFLRWLDNDEYISFTGEVDSPFGWVGLIKITPEMIRTWVSSAGDPWMSERRNFDAGWYIVRINSDGIIWGLGYGEDYTMPEESARADFAETESAYAEWLDLPDIYES